MLKPVYSRLLLPLLLLPALCAAAPRQTDFDSDGTSDFTLVDIGSSGDLSWRAALSTGELGLGTFGRSGDHLILSHWRDAAAPPELGVIQIDSASQQIAWTIRLASGESVTALHGSASDTAVAGADFDGNGLSDGVSVGARGKSWVWKIVPNMLSGSPGAASEVVFGGTIDEPFYFSLDGKRDWLAVLRRGRGRELVVRARNPQTGRQRRIPLGKRLGVTELPLPISSGNGPDLLALIDQSGVDTRILIKNARGRTVGRAILPGVGTAVAGDFAPDLPGEEVGIQTSQGFAIYNPAVRQSRSVLTSSGIPVDEININSFAQAPGRPDPQPTLAPGVCSQGDPTDGNEGFVWKPNSDTQFFAVVVLPSALTGRAVRVDTRSPDGSVINNLVGKGVGNGNRTAWQDFSLTGAQYRNTFGSIAVHVELSSGACIEYQIANPAVRVD